MRDQFLICPQFPDLFIQERRDVFSIQKIYSDGAVGIKRACRVM